MATADVFRTPELLSALVAFLAVAEHGGYSAAARHTQTDKATLSRRVRFLEETLGVRLLNRTTRTVRLTPAGQRLVSDTSGGWQAIRLGLRAAQQSLEDHTGRVRITSSPGLVDDLWASVLLQLKDTHPGIDVVIHTTVSFHRLVDTGFDVGIRTGHLPITGEIGRKLASWRYVMVASPPWQKAHATETVPSPTARYWLLPGNVPQVSRWTLEHAGQKHDFDLSPILTSDDPLVLRKMALEGLGAYMAPPPVVSEDLTQGRLVRVFPDWRVDHVHKFYAVLPHRKHVPAVVEVVLDAITRRFSVLQEEWQRMSE